VRAVFDGDTREVPVAGGVYLVAWWRVPSPGHGRRARGGVPHRRPLGLGLKSGMPSISKIVRPM
jgi:hypothetical protein